MRTHGWSEPGSLMVRIGFDDRAELLVAAPDLYNVTEHDLNCSAVMVRMSRVAPYVLRDLTYGKYKTDFVWTSAICSKTMILRRRDSALSGDAGLRRDEARNVLRAPSQSYCF